MTPHILIMFDSTGVLAGVGTCILAGVGTGVLAGVGTDVLASVGTGVFGRDVAIDIINSASI